MIQLREILYIEVPTPDSDAVRMWLQQTWQPITGAKITTPEGLRLTESSNITQQTELSLFIW
jgi:lycopene cyclase CruA